MKVSGGTRLNDMGGEDKEGKERDGLDISSRGPEFCSATGHQSYTPTVCGMANLANANQLLYPTFLSASGLNSDLSQQHCSQKNGSHSSEKNGFAAYEHA